MTWKKGRGRLGVLDPLLGTWRAEADSPTGLVACTRTFTRVLGGRYVELRADWRFASSAYEEACLMGVASDKLVRFWSFTSDGKHSTGVIADVTDLHPAAIGFEAQMDAGLARQAYWPDADAAAGFHWVVESRTKKGWNRFVHHRYRPV
jgi:hypothetical protein